MRLLVRLFLIFAVLLGMIAAVRFPVQAYLKKRRQPEFRLESLSSGTIRATRSATGRVEPKLKVQIGAFVSGPIVELNVDFNDEVKRGDVLAQIDPALYEASVRRDEAALATACAEVRRVTAVLQQAKNDERRGFELEKEDPDFVSDAELDRLRFGRMSLEAQLTLAESSVAQAEANLQNSKTNLRYTTISAPADGMVIDRKIDPGQTLASQFQTPELFILGVGMQEEMYVYASVDEMDIGQIKRAQAAEQPVRFRVDAYQDEFFVGKIKEIRLSSTEIQNVITYPVVVAVPNPELKLLPGMTANLTFQIEEKSDVLRIPWSAVRFFPKTEYVRPEDRHLIEGRADQATDEEDKTQTPAAMDVEELVEARRQQRRHVWLKDGDLLRAVEVQLGISDYRHAELVSGDLKPGDSVVVAVQVKK